MRFVGPVMVLLGGGLVLLNLLLDGGAYALPILVWGAVSIAGTIVIVVRHLNAYRTPQATDRPSIGVRASSWILGGAYVYCACTFPVLIVKSGRLFAEMQVPLPPLTRALLALTPAGWSVLLLCGGLGAVLKDLKSSSSWANVVTTAALLAVVALLTVGLSMPLVYLRTRLE